MKLACHQKHPPPGDGDAQCPGQGPGEVVETCGVEEAQDGANDELGIGEASEIDERLTRAGEEDGADEGARDGTGEGEMVVGGLEAGIDIVGRRAVDEDVVDGLDGEGLLDFGVWGDEEVEEDERGEDESKESI